MTLKKRVICRSAVRLLASAADVSSSSRCESRGQGAAMVPLHTEGVIDEQFFSCGNRFGRGHAQMEAAVLADFFDDLAIGCARMIDETRGVAAPCTVDGRAVGQAEEIGPAAMAALPIHRQQFLVGETLSFVEADARASGKITHGVDAAAVNGARPHLDGMGDDSNRHGTLQEERLACRPHARNAPRLQRRRDDAASPATIAAQSHQPETNTGTRP
jgi:hypothetical protein